MEFLKKHYEKLVVGLFLAAMLGFCVWSWNHLQAVDRKVGEANGAMSTDIKRKPLLAPIDPGSYAVDDALQSERQRWEFSYAPATGGLMDPFRYIRCNNQECPYILPYEYTVCPECGMHQGKAEVAGPPPGQDSDGDGIPDEAEAKFSFLNAQDPLDANLDQDKDGFSNVEEFLAGTSLTDPAATPGLISRLRWHAMRKTPLDVLFKKVTRVGDAPDKWELQFAVAGRTRWGRVGQKIDGTDYKILEFTNQLREVPDPKTGKNATRQLDESLVLLQKGDEEPIRLAINQQVFAKGTQVDFLFIRNSADPAQTLALNAIKEGGTFDLRLPTGSPERLTLKAVGENSVTVQRLGADGTPVGDEIKVRRFNPADDYRETRRNLPPGMPGGMMDTPLMMPPPQR